MTTKPSGWSYRWIVLAASPLLLACSCNNTNSPPPMNPPFMPPAQGHAGIWGARSVTQAASLQVPRPPASRPQNKWW